MVLCEALGWGSRSPPPFPRLNQMWCAHSSSPRKMSYLPAANAHNGVPCKISHRGCVNSVEVRGRGSRNLDLAAFMILCQSARWCSLAPRAGGSAGGGVARDKSGTGFHSDKGSQGRRRRGLPFSTSAKMLHFWTPVPFVRKLTDSFPTVL